MPKGAGVWFGLLNSARAVSRRVSSKAVKCWASARMHAKEGTGVDLSVQCACSEQLSEAEGIASTMCTDVFFTEDT